MFVYEHDAKRLELFVRIVYSFAVGLVIAVYVFIAEMCMFIQWIVILIFGRRSEGLYFTPPQLALFRTPLKP